MHNIDMISYIIRDMYNIDMISYNFLQHIQYINLYDLDISQGFYCKMFKTKERLM